MKNKDEKITLDVFNVCVYYFSLPDFPKNCNTVKNNNLLIRDILVSNPYNPHVEYGGQYDPNYENPLAPEYKMCSEKTRCKIMSLIASEKYDEINLLFRTGHYSLDGATTQCISGYYAVDMEKSRINPNYDKPVIYAKEARFLGVEDAIDLSDFLRMSNNRRFTFDSESKGGLYEEMLEDWVNQIVKSKNLVEEYIKETKGLRKLFKYYEFEDGPYEICAKCTETKKCPLAKRIKKKGKLFHRLPNDIATIINTHYKKTIKI